MKKNIFFTSLMLTLLIFAVAMMLNYSLDFFRLDSIMDVMQEHEINYNSYLAEEEFISAFGGEKCDAMHNKIELLKQEMRNVGIELSSYGKISLFKKKDYEYLERKYFLLELKFLASIEKLNRECSKPYIPILFFYDTGDSLSERQGYILSEISDMYKQKVIVLSIDREYDKEPLIDILLLRYNITEVPTIIIGEEIRYEGLTYSKEIEPVIEKMIDDTDYYGSEQDFSFVIDRTGTKKEELISNLSIILNKTESYFAKGDINLIIGRLENNSSKICKASDFYEKAISKNNEENALIYESLASLGCRRNKRELFFKAAESWEKAGNNFRARLNLDLANAREPSIEFSTSPLSVPRKEMNENISSIIIGEKSIILEEGDVIVSQTDRVTRDWLGYQIESSPFSENILNVFSERLTYTEDELKEDIGWHEGGRIKEMVDFGLSHEIASGTVAAKKEGRWYAPDEKGIFRFEVPLDKVLYPTTRFLREDIAVIIDTHGINMLVEQAIRKNASVVIGCCDHPGKIKAVKYLSKKGIPSVCFTDKYLPMILGTNHSVLGSPPITKHNDSLVLGKQPIRIDLNETIVAEDVLDYAKVQSYYDTPARYFRALEKTAEIKVEYVALTDMNQTHKVIQKAEEINATVIGIRIFNSDDYYNAKQWLEKDLKNKAVLFHSTAYPYGYMLIHEFRNQTTFNDISPRFE